MNELAKIDKEQGAEIIQSFQKEEVLPVTDLAFPIIKMGKDTCNFELILEGQTVKELNGYIVYKHNANAYYEGEYDGGGNMPDCASSNALNPDAGENIQSNICQICPKNQWGSAPGDSKGKACNNNVILYILLDGDEIPSVIRVRPTSRGTKSSLSQFETYLEQKLLRNSYPIMKVCLTLEKTERFPVSILIVKAGETLKEDDPLLLKIQRAHKLAQDANRQRETVRNITVAEADTEEAPEQNDTEASNRIDDDVPF